ncbi:MAG TPA: EAL domain-containing protein [Solirubrobacteraceae bacterium]|nr:EAL domain-containing protein [Solirubrobacteraceae bacterium]
MRWRSRGSVLLAVVILLGGSALSVAAGLSWRASLRAQHRRAFERTAGDVTTSLAAMLSRDTDFFTSLRAVLSMQPHMSPTRFALWFAEMQGRQRQVGSVGTSVIASVSPTQLPAFLARRDGDPAFRLFLGSAPTSIAPQRSGVCLLSAGVSTGGSLAPTVARVLQGDWCRASSGIGISQARTLRAQANSGEVVVLPVTSVGMQTTHFFQAAFYRSGATLRTARQRRTALRGWVSSSFDIPALIKAATKGHPGLGVALYHANPGEPAELIDRAGVVTRVGAPHYREDLQIEGPWTIVVSQVAANGMSPGLAGSLVTGVGLLISVLAFALMLVLSHSRERALAMVRQKTGELRHQALHDALTGLPNRLLAVDRAEQMLLRAGRSHMPVAALYVDLDGFKHVNDTFGHAAGDELLCAVATRLRAVLRDGDTAARLGGDEFVVLLDGCELDAEPELIAERILEALRQPYELRRAHGRRLSFTASVGIALAGDGGADQLLHDADLALYEAKAEGRDRSAIFHSEMETASRERLTLEMDLAEAQERGQLFLLYQPTVDLRTEQIVGVEALIRWRHPTRGVLGPCDFIPLAEQTGLIVPIGRWVLGEAVRQAAAWSRQGCELGVAVNVSARQLDTEDLVGDVRDALAGSGLSPDALTLEITETALMRDADAAMRKLRSLKHLGVRVAIDDFGTGYSSLAYLRQFPADVLKIDRSFVEGVATGPDCVALIETLVTLGRSLRIDTLAEGVEEAIQLHALQGLGCDLGQGYLFSRPVSPGSIPRLAAASRARVQAERPVAKQRSRDQLSLV